MDGSNTRNAVGCIWLHGPGVMMLGRFARYSAYGNVIVFNKCNCTVPCFKCTVNLRTRRFVPKGGLESDRQNSRSLVRLMHRAGVL